jgi:hypothetical protein
MKHFFSSYAYTMVVSSTSHRIYLFLGTQET